MPPVAPPNRSHGRGLPAWASPARVALAALFLAGATPVARCAPADGVRLAPATPGAVRFTVTVPEPKLVRVDLEQAFDALDLPGYSASGEPGTPVLPTRTLTIAVPPVGEVRLTAAASEAVVHDGVNLAPFPGMDRDGKAVRTIRKLAAYGAAGSGTPVAARLVDVTWMRNQRVAHVSIEPAAYEPAARRLAVAARVDVELAVATTGALGPPAEPDDPFESVYRLTVVNYQQGIAWRRPRTQALASTARRLGLPFGARAAQLAPPDTSVYVGRTWIKIAVQRTGFYQVNFSRLRGLALFDPNSPAPIDSLRLFTWPGRTVLPEDSYCDSCDFREVAIGIVRDVSTDASHPGGDGPPDGKFADNNDAFYFFAQGPDGWESDFDDSRPDTNYIDHPYEKSNFYYLTVATDSLPMTTASYPFPPQRIGAGAGTRRSVRPTGGETPAATVAGRVHYEQDNEYWPDATALRSTLVWQKWFWRSLTSGQNFPDSRDLLDADTTKPARFRLRQWGLSDNHAIFGGTACDASVIDHLLDVSFNSVTFPTRSWNGQSADQRGVQTFDTTGVFLRRRGNLMTMSVPTVPFDRTCPNRLDRSGLAFYEIYYERRPQPVGDAIEFRTHPDPGTFRYDIGPFAHDSSNFVFDLTDPTRPVLLDDAVHSRGANGVTISLADTQTVSHRYAVVPDSIITQNSAVIAASAVSDAPFTSANNLRSRTQVADYLIIYFDGFKAAADSLAAWRKDHLPLLSTPAPHTALTVPISAIYDQFSGGRTDPGAIRNFLRAASGWSRRPLYVLFLGDASFDYKDITGRATPGLPGCLLPTYENGFDDSPIIRRQYSTDDWLVNVDDPVVVVPDYLTGRIPAGDAATAVSVVTQKVLAFERAAPFGEYRNSLILMADDNIQGDDCDPLTWTHVAQTTALDQRDTPLHMDREYVYLHTFESGPGSTKPGARTQLFKDLDAGTSLFNYVGHGSPFKMTDEGVFLDTDAGTLTNGLRQSLLVSASCDVGKFDDPSVASLGERIFTSTNGGCIAVVSATEQALSNLNSALNGLIYDALFDRDTLSVAGIFLPSVGQYHVPVSAALLSAKSDPGIEGKNSQKYQLMGDPATLLNLPRLWTDFTLTDENGAPLTQVARGSTVRFDGQVVDRPGGSPVPMDGVASILIEDSAPTNLTPNECAPSIPYVFSAGPMYHGDVTLKAGRFSGRFVVPLDATTGTKGRIRAYFNGREPAASETDGAGAEVVTVAQGLPPTDDTEGPRITLSFVGGSTSVRPDATLQINLFDDHGIMTTGHAPQNSIIVTMDENTTSRTDVTQSFRYAADSYQSGTASFQLPGLSAGAHHISVQAADNLATGLTAVQHRSTASIDFEVVNTPPLKVARTFMFPNPVRSGGAGSGGVIVVDAPGDSINVLIRVYTVAGKLIRELRQLGGIGQVQVPWDGLDDEGDRLAQGTYLYKVYVGAREADGRTSPRQNATALGRFVVLSP
jgi:hypothetical protein